MYRLLARLLFVFVIFLSWQASAQDVQTFEHVSLVALIANPEKYDNHHVGVEGIAYFDSKNGINGIFLTREDKENANGQNAVFVVFTASVKNPDQFNNRFVLVQGRFDAQDKGHLGSFCGTVKDVIRVHANAIKIK
ncbi:MAG: hypothetical protein DMF18_01205 [Verrucomicrobia bacterium]|nr:MAG: hypothetical protein DMF18_01205 [Verrucomicrobiota bacterium]